MTTAKAVIKFDKGIVTLRFGKSKISFHRIPETLYKAEKGIKNNIRPIAPTIIVNRLVLEWEERIKLHLEKKMKFDQRRNKNFTNKRPALVKIENGMDDEGEVTFGTIGIHGSIHLMKNWGISRKAHLLEDNQIPSVGVFDEVLQIVAGDGVASIKRRRRDLYSDSIRNLATTSSRSAAGSVVCATFAGVVERREWGVGVMRVDAGGVGVELEHSKPGFELQGAKMVETGKNQNFRLRMARVTTPGLRFLVSFASFLYLNVLKLT
ncbi:hypothetical protein Tco_0919572 [Tanacetum coccineum]